MGRAAHQWCAARFVFQFDHQTQKKNLGTKESPIGASNSREASRASAALGGWFPFSLFC
jgi:hypothetical protein